MPKLKTVKLTLLRKRLVEQEVTDHAVCSLNGKRYHVAPGDVTELPADVARAVKALLPQLEYYVEPEAEAGPAEEN